MHCIPGPGWDLKGSEEGILLLGNRFWLDSGGSPAGKREERQTRGLERWLLQAGLCPFPAPGQGVPDGALAGAPRAHPTHILRRDEAVAGDPGAASEPLPSALPIPGAAAVCPRRAGDASGMEKLSPHTVFKLPRASQNKRQPQINRSVRILYALPHPE